ncbi:MAG: helix-turn-helix domain-containing protein [Verrucomicrobia bacterium]|nr:helix-turn-helix domain-containing protein [Verrucomicrobiota bacterium]
MPPSPSPSTEPRPPADLMTAEELGAYLKVDPHTVLNWGKAGIIPEAMRVGRTVRFSKSAVDAALDMNRHGEGREVELVSLALKTMLGVGFARTPAINPDSVTLAELTEIKRQMDAHAANLQALGSPEERAHYAEGVLEAARIVARLGRGSADD